GRVDPQSLHPIRHRSREVRQDLVVWRVRDALVSVRTELINTTRGLVKSMGTRLPRCSSPSFAEKVKDAIPVEVREALLPLVQLVETVNDAARRVIRNKIPTSYHVGHGHIVDTNLTTSPQIDALITDSSSPKRRVHTQPRRYRKRSNGDCKRSVGHVLTWSSEHYSGIQFPPWGRRGVLVLRTLWSGEYALCLKSWFSLARVGVSPQQLLPL